MQEVLQKELDKMNELLEGIRSILKAKIGTIIVLIDEKDIDEIADSGFKLNEKLSASKIYELSKMDGAILVSKDTQKIYMAGTELKVDYFIDTFETGIRHKTSDRISKMLNTLVFCVSQRKNEVTLYNGKNKYLLEEI